MRGLPSMAGRVWMNGGANAARITWGESLRSRPRSAVAVSKIAAVERRKARVPSQRRAGAFAKVPQLDLRRSGAPPPSGEATRPGPGPSSEGKGLREAGTRWSGDPREFVAWRRERALYQP